MQIQQYMAHNKLGNKVAEATLSRLATQSRWQVYFCRVS